MMERTEKAPVIGYDLEDLTARRQRDIAGLRKAKEMEQKREFVYVKVDFQTVKMVEKSKYEKLFKSKYRKS